MTTGIPSLTPTPLPVFEPTQLPTTWSTSPPTPLTPFPTPLPTPFPTCTDFEYWTDAIEFRDEYWTAAVCIASICGAAAVILYFVKLFCLQGYFDEDIRSFITVVMGLSVVFCAGSTMIAIWLTDQACTEGENQLVQIAVCCIFAGVMVSVLVWINPEYDGMYRSRMRPNLRPRMPGALPRFPPAPPLEDGDLHDLNREEQNEAEQLRQLEAARERFLEDTDSGGSAAEEESGSDEEELEVRTCIQCGVYRTDNLTVRHCEICGAALPMAVSSAASNRGFANVVPAPTVQVASASFTYESQVPAAIPMEALEQGDYEVQQAGNIAAVTPPPAEEQIQGSGNTLPSSTLPDPDPEETRMASSPEEASTTPISMIDGIPIDRGGRAMALESLNAVSGI